MERLTDRWITVVAPAIIGGDITAEEKAKVLLVVRAAISKLDFAR